MAKAPPSNPLEMRSAEEIDFEKDALHLLPLEIIPLRSAALSRARLVKDVRMKGMLEVFWGAGTGSGRLDPAILEQSFDIEEEAGSDDGEVIRALAALNSFDVYSLRIQLRALGINVDNVESLRLSERKRAQLTKYMVGVTRPLIRQIYGSEATEITDISDLVAMFSNPDRDEALKNLRLMTEALKIGITELPRFLEDYGDTFLSLAYFKDCLSTLEPQLDSFYQAIENIRQNHQLRQNRRLMNTLDEMTANFTSIKATLEAHFFAFERETEVMWSDMSAKSFSDLKNMIENSHTTIGGILCGLSVKMDAWSARFGDSDGAVVSQAEFISSDLRQGMDVLVAMCAEVVDPQALRNT